MKYLIRLFKVILILTIVVCLLVFAFLLADRYNTAYLNLNKDNLTAKNSFIIGPINILPMTSDTVFENKFIYVNQGHIQELADSIDYPGVPHIEVDGNYLMPGLIDMHVHVWDRYELGLYLANGVTAIRNVWGMPMHLRMKEDLENQSTIGPAFFTSGPKLTGPEFIGDDNLQLYSPEQGRQKLINYKNRGYDFIKTYYGLPKDIFDAIIEQAEISGMDIVAHPSQKVPYAYHFNTQIKSIEHAEDIVQLGLDYKLDTLGLEKLISTYKKAQYSSFCPTLTVYHNIYRLLTEDGILSSENLLYINPLIRKVDSKAQFDRWQSTKDKDPSISQAILDQHRFHLYIINRLHNADINIICGTDAGIGITLPGYSIHNELEFYSQAGLSNYDVLKTATINASRTHDIMNNLGSIEVGKMANIIMLDRNPLEDLSTLRRPGMVIINGQILDRTRLDNFEHRAHNRNNLVASGLRYAENLIVEK